MKVAPATVVGGGSVVVVVLSVELQRRIKYSQILNCMCSRCCACGRRGEIKITGKSFYIEPLRILDVPAVGDHPNLAALVARAPQGQPGRLLLLKSLLGFKGPGGGVDKDASKGWEAKTRSSTVNLQKRNREDAKVDVHLHHSLPCVLAHNQRELIDLSVGHKTRSVQSKPRTSHLIDEMVVH